MSNNMPRQSREKSGTGIYQMIIRTVPLIVNDKTVYAPFSDMREPYIQQTGSISKKAIIVFNTSEIKQMQFREISIEVGAINPSALFTKPLIFTWSILDKPFISPK